MKKAISLILVLVLCLGICACGKKEESKAMTFQYVLDHFQPEMSQEDFKKAFGEPDYCMKEGDRMDFMYLGKEMLRFIGVYKVQVGDVQMAVSFSNNSTSFNRVWFHYHMSGEDTYTQEDLEIARKDFDKVLAFLKEKYGEPTIQSEHQYGNTVTTSYFFSMTSSDGKTAQLELRETIDQCISTDKYMPGNKPFGIFFYGWE